MSTQQTMKKLINSPDAVVREALEGIELAYGDRLRVSHDPAYIVRADAPVEGKVGIVSGGGSGHEPMHGGFVGRGMLDAACPGRCSPPRRPIRCWRRPRPSTAAPESCTSSRTTPATS